MLAVDLAVPGDPATLTGGYLYDRRILEGLQRLGWTTRVHALDPAFPLPGPTALREAAAAFAAIPAGRVVVVDGLALAGLAPLLERERTRLRLAALVHHPASDETGLTAGARERLRREELRACAAVERVVVTSAWTARRLKALGLPEERVTVVEPGTSPPAAPPAPRTGARGGPLRLLCVATVTERKGHVLLLDALARLRDRPWHLECAGSEDRDPATAAAVRARIEKLDLSERVTLRGELSAAALEECYARADVFVLPSYLEGYGMAFAEALARGLPAIGTTAGAIAETVGDAGLLVPPGDPHALADALAKLLDDAALRRALAERAEARRQTLPSWSEASARFAAAIADLAGLAGPRQ